MYVREGLSTDGSICQDTDFLRKTVSNVNLICQNYLLYHGIKRRAIA